MIFHKNLPLEKWETFPTNKKVLMIASEFSRATHLAPIAEKNYIGECFERAVELIELCHRSPSLRTNSEIRKLLYKTEEEVYRIFGTIQRREENWRKTVQINSQKLYNRMIELSETRICPFCGHKYEDLILEIHGIYSARVTTQEVEESTLCLCGRQYTNFEIEFEIKTVKMTPLSWKNEDGIIETIAERLAWHL